MQEPTITAGSGWTIEENSGESVNDADRFVPSDSILYYGNSVFDLKDAIKILKNTSRQPIYYGYSIKFRKRKRKAKTEFIAIVTR